MHCCISTATVVTRTPHNVTLYLHFLSCYFKAIDTCFKRFGGI